MGFITYVYIIHEEYSMKDGRVMKCNNINSSRKPSLTGLKQMFLEHLFRTSRTSKTSVFRTKEHLFFRTKEYLILTVLTVKS